MLPVKGGAWLRVITIRGMNDILQMRIIWRHLKILVYLLLQLWLFTYPYPNARRAGLICSSVGENSDVVTKEMYAFEDRNGVDLVLRPEGTAPTGADRAWFALPIKFNACVMLARCFVVKNTKRPLSTVSYFWC